MRFAPIIIPTLNRYQHLDRMMMSILNNTFVNETELYLSVDYPPNAAYFEGYRKVCDYVNDSCKLWEEKFKRVHIFFQKKNLGPINNSDFLFKIVKEDGHEQYIFSEDDNYFGPCVLDFLNYELEYFSDDDSIYAICTNGAFPVEGFDTNIVRTTNLSGHVYGGWFKKQEYYEQITTLSYARKNWTSPKVLFRLIKENIGVFFELENILVGKKPAFIKEDGKICLIDQILKIHLILDKRYVISPSIPLSTNYGYDGSGVNCKKEKNYSPYTMDMNSTFEHINYDYVPISKIYFRLTFYIIIKAWLCCIKIWIYQLIDLKKGDKE